MVLALNKEELLNHRGKLVRHFKGDLYQIINVAEHTEEGTELVIYRALYGDCKIYARPLSMFVEKVPEGKENPTGQEYRFAKFSASSIKGEATKIVENYV